MRFSKVSVIAVIAVMAMVFCSFVPVANGSVSDGTSASDTQAQDKTYRYVSLGDSMSVGYALTGYYPDDTHNQYGFLMDVEDTYPHMLTEYLRSELGEGYDVYHAQIGMSGVRSVEIRALVDDDFTGKDQYLGDSHTVSYFSGDSLTVLADAARGAYPDIASKYERTDAGNFALMREVYKTELAAADLITYNSHYDFAYDVAGKVLEIVQGGPGLDTDFTLYYEPQYVEMAKNVGSMVLDYLIDYLAKQGIDLSDYRDMIEKLAKAITYAIISYCANFDGIMEYIFSVNPDAKVLAIDSYNTFRPMVVSYSGMTLSLSDIYDMTLDIINPYVKYSSPYALDCYHVDVEDDPMMLGQEFRDLERNQLTDDAKSGLIRAMGLVDRPADPQGLVLYETIDVVGNLSKFMKYVFSSSEIDADAIIGKDIGEITKAITEKVTAAVKLFPVPLTSVTLDPNDGSCTVSLRFVNTVTFTKAELSFLWTYLYLMASDYVMSHPSAYGHAYIESCIEAEIVKDDILSEGNRVYITEDDMRTNDGEDGYSLLHNYAARSVRGFVNYFYLNWDETVEFVNSDAYIQEYDEIKELYAKWQNYLKTGLDGDLDAVHERLIYIDANWDTIFAGYTEDERVKQLHAVLQNILLNWDAVKAGIIQYAGLMDLRLGYIVGILEPDTIRALLADKEFTVSARETLLNIGLNSDAFVDDIYDDLIKAETPEQFLDLIEKTLSDYQRPCHEAKMYAAVEPTCTTTGWIQHFKCKICSAYFVQDSEGRYVQTTEEDITLPIHHELVEHAAVTPTCINEGSNLYYTCQKCDVVLKADKITPTTVEAEKLAKTDHIHETVPGLTPTKTESGWTDGEVCSYCKAVLIESKEIPATGSDKSEIVSERSNVTFIVADSDEIKTLEVKIDDKQSGVISNVSVPESTLASMKGKEIQFGVTKSTKYSDAYEISLSADDKEFSGEVYISIQYDAAKGIPAVKWVEGDSKMEVVSTDSSAGLITFKTTHNSTYQVTYSQAASDNTMTIVIVAIIAIIALLIIGVVVWKKKSKA